ncbi:hypothetical protein [Paenibacillus thalictri]|nr:hypothetical protein [Paenibacillus thalictri]
MLLDSSDKPYDFRDYIFEPKLQGVRAILMKSGPETRLFFQKDIEVTRLFPELYHVPIDGDVTLDGVICSGSLLGRDMESGSTLVQKRARIKKRKQIAGAARELPVRFVAFDILTLKGRDLRKLSLMKRKSILDSVLLEDEYYKRIRYFEEDKLHLYGVVYANVKESIIAKRKDSKYVSRRTHDWVELTHPDMVRKELTSGLLEADDN